MGTQAVVIRGRIQRWSSSWATGRVGRDPGGDGSGSMSVIPENTGERRASRHLKAAPWFRSSVPNQSCSAPVVEGIMQVPWMFDSRYQGRVARSQTKVKGRSSLAVLLSHWVRIEQNSLFREMQQETCVPARFHAYRKRHTWPIPPWSVSERIVDPSVSITPCEQAQIRFSCQGTTGAGATD